MDELPLVLVSLRTVPKLDLGCSPSELVYGSMVGLRTVPKEDLGCSPSELVYGSTIHLPGEFFKAARSAAKPDMSDFLACLHKIMAGLRPKETANTGISLQCTYDGPFRVLDRQPNTSPWTSMPDRIQYLLITSNLRSCYLFWTS